MMPTNNGLNSQTNETIDHTAETTETGRQDQPLDEQSPRTPRWQDQTQRMVAVHHTIFPTGYQLEDDVLVYH